MMAQYTTKMLVADDSRTVQLFFEGVVAKSRVPIELLTADNGRECLILLEQGGVDLAFIDISMPEMSGLEAVSRARFTGNKTFITFISGKGAEDRFEVARHLRAYEYLVKPFADTDVEAIVNAYRQVSRKMKTLVVDDSRTMRRTVRRVLGR